MIDTDAIIDALLFGFKIAFKACAPYIITTLFGAIGLLIVKSLISSMIDFFRFGYNASETRKIKKSAFKFIELISALSDLFPSKK